MRQNIYFDKGIGAERDYNYLIKTEKCHLADNYFIKTKVELHQLIGQAPYEFQTVFSFFLPEYQPQGMYFTA